MPKRVRIRPESITSIYEQKVAQAVRQRQMAKINSNTLNLITNINNDMRDLIGEKLREGVLQGRSVAATASTLLKTGLDKGVFRSARQRAWLIARTELHRARQAAAIDVYNANGIKMLQWIGIADGRLCDVCAGRHGKIYAIDKLHELGAIPPVHPRCRCRLVPKGFKLDIIVKKTKEGKVLETKISPNPTDYLYVVSLSKKKR
jgi:SPP1 gp7 family putative phage head morphogenesis protein